jgi:adenylate cyclase
MAVQSVPERREAAIFYAELRNFTRLSEVLPPDKVLALANDFFSLSAMSVTANRGKVLSVQNDMLVGAFGGHNRRDFAERALNSAQDISREFAAMGEQWKSAYGLPAAVAVALHIGEAVFGMAGPIGAQQFVAFGDCVSIAERLVHRARAGETLFSRDFVEALGVRPEVIGAAALPPLEIAKRPPIPVYGITLEKRLDFT